MPRTFLAASGVLASLAAAIALLFAFNEAGLIDTVQAQARGRAVGRRIVPTPRQGRSWNYQVRSGMLAPLDGGVAWLTGRGARPYWRGGIIRITHQMAG